MENILSKIKSIEFDKNKEKLFNIKSAILWGNSSEDNISFPLLYITKPKHISQEDFDIILEKLQINILK